MTRTYGATCYHCGQPIEGAVVWDTEPDDPAFHPVCAETARREMDEGEE
jgi:hypothetical protein